MAIITNKIGQGGKKRITPRQAVSQGVIKQLPDQHAINVYTNVQFEGVRPPCPSLWN
jgi:hypothetical protein